MGFKSEHIRQLLHNKFVVVLGDSIQRSVYKDLVKLLQCDNYLCDKELRDKGEMSFANDTLVEGGLLGKMTNDTSYCEVRQYRSDHHLVRFYFLTQVFSEYVESVLADFKAGPPPDVLIMNSCIWDLNSRNHQAMESYKTNLDSLFSHLAEVLSPECLVIWGMTMPVGIRRDETPSSYPLIDYPNAPNLRLDIIEGNFYSSTLANLHEMDVVDMHFHFRFELRNRCNDFIHWNGLAHRDYSEILLAHIAQAWGVELPETPEMKREPVPRNPPPVVVPKRIVPFQNFVPNFVAEVGPPGFGHRMPFAPSPVFPMRNFSHPFPQPVPQPFQPFNNQEFGQRFIAASPSVHDSQIPFGNPCPRNGGYGSVPESFPHGSMGFHGMQMGSNAASPSVHDSQIPFGNPCPRNGGYGNVPESFPHGSMDFPVMQMGSNESFHPGSMYFHGMQMGSNAASPSVHDSQIPFSNPCPRNGGYGSVPESFPHGSMDFPVMQMGSNAASPFNDSQIQYGNPPPGNGGYGNVPVPYNDIPPFHNPWNDRHELHKRRKMRQKQSWMRKSKAVRRFLHHIR